MIDMIDMIEMIDVIFDYHSQYHQQSRVWINHPPFWHTIFNAPIQALPKRNIIRYNSQIISPVYRKTNRHTGLYIYSGICCPYFRICNSFRNRCRSPIIIRSYLRQLQASHMPILCSRHPYHLLAQTRADRLRRL